jgi:Ser/Thr protein kinase RdoA (MazF antagonist)
MSEPFPATYSIPAPRAIREELLPLYDIGRPVECRLYMSGVNDIYTVATERGRYVLKLYRHGWRTEAEVQYELNLLAHLDSKGVPVALPVPRTDGRLAFPLPALEGERQCVLFQYAPGRAPTWPFHENEAESRLMGAALAAIHNTADGFSSSHPRFQHDEALHLDGTLAAVRPFLAEREADGEYLQALMERMRERLRALASRGLSWGICHGDYHGGNLFIDDDRRVTTFDFDVCGAGWLAFDLARWRRDSEGKDESWRAFLHGYREHRRLSAADLEAVPLFILMRTLDWMRVKSTFTALEAWDSWDMPFYLNDTLALLKEREEEALGLGSQ